jgi:Tol biopolymer transport system component
MRVKTESDQSEDSVGGHRAVFLSYASEDTDAAGRIAEALRAAGVEVWFDRSALKTGDAWDQKIRREIRQCGLFVPIISRNTQARTEGYFRLEWHLADQRSQLMARSRPFLIPICIDDTPEFKAEVPESFEAVQWARLPSGHPSAAFAARIAHLLSPEDRQLSAQPTPPEAIATPTNAILAGAATDGRPGGLGSVFPKKPSSRRVRTWLLPAVPMLVVAVVAVWWFGRKDTTEVNPLASAKFSHLAGFEGAARAAAISRDGKFVAFLANRDGRDAIWLGEFGSDTYRNLTSGDQHELRNNPEIRSLDFSADSSLVSFWVRNSDGSRPEDINILSVPVHGGPLQVYLKEVAEYDWSHDGRKMVFHTTGPGDPMFLRESGRSDRLIYVAPAGVHCHFPTWSPDDAFIYFVRGIPSDGVWDIWRVRPSGAGLERLTTHNSYVAYPTLLDGRTLLYLATADGAGPWLYALDTDRRVPQRVSFGLESYTSLGASTNGKHLVATVTDLRSSLWRLPLSDANGVHPSSAITPSLVRADGATPRRGPDYTLYVAWRSGKKGIWAFSQGGATREVWSSGHLLILGAPAIAPDGRHIAFIAKDNDKTLLYVIDQDGSHLKVVADSYELRGNPAWTADGQSIVTAAVQNDQPRLTTFFLNGAPPLPLVAEYSLDPVWAPNGQFFVYSGADVGTTFPLRAAARDGRPYSLPNLFMTRGARRVAFLPDGQSLVVMRGDFEHKDLALINLHSGAERVLAVLPADFIIDDFDVSSDGSEIFLDRIQQNSELALIERTP